MALLQLTEPERESLQDTLNRRERTYVFMATSKEPCAIQDARRFYQGEAADGESNPVFRAQPHDTAWHAG
jgi:hypothetical protein